MVSVCVILGFGVFCEVNLVDLEILAVLVFKGAPASPL